jgi:hypothetical protein
MIVPDVPDVPDLPAGGGEQRELLARLRAVIEAKDTEIGVPRSAPTRPSRTHRPPQNLLRQRGGTVRPPQVSPRHHKPCSSQAGTGHNLTKRGGYPASSADSPRMVPP